MNVIIPRNSTIPIKAGEMFTNAVAGQSVVRIHVLQGEREMARDNWSLGRFDLEFEATAKAQARIGVQFEIDADGILQVLARDTRTGVERRVEMSSAVDVSDEAIEKMLEESLEHAFEDVNERVFTEASLKAREMLKAVEVALQRAGNALESAERLEIQQAALAVEEALCGGAPAPLKKAMAALDHQTDRLAAVLIEMAMGKS
jgi:molecular chaperone DnaK